jgi:hypothetical protein
MSLETKLISSLEKVVVSILEISTKRGAIKDKVQTQKAKFYNLWT